MNTQKTIYILLAALALTVLLLSACGSGESDNPAEAAVEQEETVEEGGHDDEISADSIEGAKSITVLATEFGFEPASIELQAGEPVNIMLVNEGVIEHELQIEEFDFHVHTQAGETAMAGLTPDVSGTFEFGCHIPGHYEAGMVGAVEVIGEQGD